MLIGHQSLLKKEAWIKEKESNMSNNTSKPVPPPPIKIIGDSMPEKLIKNPR